MYSMYLSHSHVIKSLHCDRILKLTFVVMYLGKGGGGCICILGEVAMMSLSGLHSYVWRVRCGIEC